MRVNEFIEACNSMPQMHGDMEIRVSALGGMREGKSIKSLRIGFDWDMGAVILEPTIPLTIKGVRRDAHGKSIPCKHESTHWRVDPFEKHIGRSIEVCNECGMSRKHTECDMSTWINADIDDFPVFPGHAEVKE